MRKHFWIVVSLVALMSSAAIVAAQQDYSGRTLRVAMWGGGWMEAQSTVIGQCFQEKTGASVEYVPGNPLDNLAKLLSAKAGGLKPPFDLLHTTQNVQLMLIDEGLVEQQSAAEIANIADLWPETDTGGGYGRAFYYSFSGISYNTEKFAELGLPEPTSIEDLFRPELKGHVAYPALSHSQGPSGVVAMALAAGGSVENIEPGLKRIRELDPIIYEDSSELESRFLSGEVWAAWWIDGRTWSLKDDGFPINFVRPQVGDKKGFASFGIAEVVKGTPNRDLANIWLDCQYSGESGYQITGTDNYGAPSESAAQLYSQDPTYSERYLLSADEMSEAMILDWRYINGVWDKWQDLWNRTILF